MGCSARTLTTGPHPRADIDLAVDPFASLLSGMIIQ
jgi:hypothetical protein